MHIPLDIHIDIVSYHSHSILLGMHKQWHMYSVTDQQSQQCYYRSSHILGWLNSIHSCIWCIPSWLDQCRHNISGCNPYRLYCPHRWMWDKQVDIMFYMSYRVHSTMLHIHSCLLLGTSQWHMQPHISLMLCSSTRQCRWQHRIHHSAGIHWWDK